MATAPRRISLVPGTAAPEPTPVALEFTLYQDNGGAYRWLLGSPDGAVLARSRGFASRDDAEQAAQLVIDNARWARLAPGPGDFQQVAYTHPGSIASG